MEIIEAIILGIIQGLTEFLPVSSSGHLEIAKFLFGDTTSAESSMLMTVVLHGATALSTIVIFRKDIMEIINGLFQFQWNEQSQFSVKIILSMIPAAMVGVLFESELETLFGGQIRFVGFMLIITSILLYLADKSKITKKNVSFTNSVIIGISQAIAILPGISRSGATISTSVLLGIDKERSARFSFLMVVPLILGKMAKDILSGEISTDLTNISALSFGFVSAFLVGLVACKWMISIVKKGKLSYFAIYCLLVGLGTVILSLTF